MTENPDTTRPNATGPGAAGAAAPAPPAPERTPPTRSAPAAPQPTPPAVSAAEGRAAASDAPALGMHDPAGTPSAPRRRFRLGRRAVTALVLVGVLLVGGAGGFAIGRATAPGPAFPAFERGDGPGGRLPGGGGDGEMPQPPSGRSGSGSDPGSGDTGTDADPGSADAGTTDSSATT